MGDFVGDTARLKEVREDLEAHKKGGPEKIKEELEKQLKRTTYILGFYRGKEPDSNKDNEEHEKLVHRWSERESLEKEELRDYLGIFHRRLEELEWELRRLLLDSDRLQADKGRVDAAAKLALLRKEFEVIHKPALEEAREEAYQVYKNSLTARAEASTNFGENSVRVHHLETRIRPIDKRLVVIRPIYEKFVKLLEERILESKTTKVKSRLEHVEGKIPGTQDRVDILKEQISQLEAEKSVLATELEQARAEEKVLLARIDTARKLSEAANARYSSFRISIPKAEKEYTEEAENALARAEAEIKRLRRIYLDNEY